MNSFALSASPLSSVGRVLDASAQPESKGADAPSFGQMLQSAFGQVSALQDHSASMTQAFARGQISDVHSVMIASEQATMALQLTTQIRNKAIDAYQEIMRISM